MADAPTYFSTIQTDAVNAWIAEEMYTLSERQLVLGQYAKRYTLPERNSKTMRIVRYKRMSNPTATLTEGTPPDAIALSVENVDVTVEQWGLVALLTDVAEVTTRHPALNIAIERVSRAMTETIEREMAKVLLGGTNVVYGTDATSRAGLTGAKVLTTGNILSAVSLLRSNGAMDFEGGLFMGCMPPQVEATILGDSTFSNAASYSQVVRLNVGEIGIWAGVRWVRSNALPIYLGVAAPTTAAANATKAQLTGYSTSGGALDGSKLTIVARDIQSGYDRKISQELTVADADGAFAIVFPSSANYLYDVYMTSAAGTVYKRILTGQVASSTSATVNAALYTAGTVADPPAAPADTKEVFVSWVLGRDAFGRVELSGMSMESFLTPKEASYSNPLAQGRKVGAKVMWKSFIIDNSFFCRLEANSTYSANLPA